MEISKIIVATVLKFTTTDNDDDDDIDNKSEKADNIITDEFLTNHDARNRKKLQKNYY